MLLLLALACGPGAEGPADTAGNSPPGPLLLVADTGTGRARVYTQADGAPRGGPCLADLMPGRCGGGGKPCLLFDTQHEAESDADVLTLTWGWHSSLGIPGQVSRLRFDVRGVQREWSFDALTFPADDPLAAECAEDAGTLKACQLVLPHATLTLDDGTRVVADTGNNRVIFVRVGEPDGGEAHVSADVVGRIDPPDNGASAWWPNALSRTPEGLLVVSYKGADPAVTGYDNTGRILAFDVSEPSAPTLAWAFPPSGWLGAVHGAWVDPEAGLLYYGHAYGMSDDVDAGDLGSVGVARLGLEGPTYLADFVLPDGVAPFGFVREAEVTADGSVVITDSGCENTEVECSLPGRVLVSPPFALPEPTGLDGAWSPDHARQHVLPLEGVDERVTDTLAFPFETDAVEDAVGPLASIDCP